MEESKPHTKPSICHLLVSVIIPVCNEEEAIAGVIDDVRQSMESAGYRYEIVVVDDRSADRTASVAESKGVQVIRRPFTGGSGACRKTGILAVRGEVVVMLDGDGTYAAADIPRLLEHMPAYDQVNGARTSEQGNLKLLRVPAKWVIRKLACYLTGTHIPDLNTGLKAFRRDVMLEYLWVLPQGFSCVTSMTLAFLCNGYAVKYVPTTYRKRIGRSKFHPVLDTWRYLTTIVRMVLFFAPLHIFGPAAALVLLASTATGCYHMFVADRHSLQETDIILFVGGVAVLAIGMLAELMVRQRATNDLELRYWQHVFHDDADSDDRR